MKYNIDYIINIAKEAGFIVMNHYKKDFIEVTYKEDSSPVSVADLESNKLICESLLKLYPNIPIISEEEDEKERTNNHNLFWLIDPLDGTKSFLKKNGEFTINIALIKNNIPIMGVVYSPLSDRLYYVGQDNIPYKIVQGVINSIKVRKIPEQGATVVTSSSSINGVKLNNFLKNKKIDKTILTSSSIKICMIAEGVADIYPRFGQTMEWDTAAGHAILNASGGSITTFEGNNISYGNIEKKYHNPEFIAMGKK